MAEEGCVKSNCGIIGYHTHLDEVGTQPGAKLVLEDRNLVVGGARRGRYRVDGVTYAGDPETIDAAWPEEDQENPGGENPANMITLLATLLRRGIITTNPSEAGECCGIPRDDDGFCVHRPGHPIYVRVNL